MARRTILLVTLILCVATVSGAASSTPVIEGGLTGVELCPQDWCGAAWFGASFVGTVKDIPTTGVALAGINHEPLPDPGDTSNITGGTLSLQTWRGSFSGSVSGGTLFNNGDETYTVELTVMLKKGGTGKLFFVGLLDHRPLNEGLPPTISGRICQEYLGCLPPD